MIYPARLLQGLVARDNAERRRGAGPFSGGRLAPMQNSGATLMRARLASAAEGASGA